VASAPHLLDAPAGRPELAPNGARCCALGWAAFSLLRCHAVLAGVAPSSFAGYPGGGGLLDGRERSGRLWSRRGSRLTLLDDKHYKSLSAVARAGIMYDPCWDLERVPAL
jgi:hypothetical protein